MPRGQGHNVFAANDLMHGSLGFDGDDVIIGALDIVEIDAPEATLTPTHGAAGDPCALGHETAGDQLDDRRVTAVAQHICHPGRVELRIRAVRAEDSRRGDSTPCVAPHDVNRGFAAPQEESADEDSIRDEGRHGFARSDGRCTSQRMGSEDDRLVDVLEDGASVVDPALESHLLVGKRVPRSSREVDRGDSMVLLGQECDHAVPALAAEPGSVDQDDWLSALHHAEPAAASRTPGRPRRQPRCSREELRCAIEAGLAAQDGGDGVDKTG